MEVILNYHLLNNLFTVLPTGFINTFLSARLWKPLAKLSYCMYLLHLPLQAMIFGSMRTSQYFADIHIIHHFWGDFGFTITIAVIWHLAFEMPFVSLERILFNRGEKLT